MSISPPTLSALQQAGESLHAARQAFAQEVQLNAGRVVGIVASEPFSPEADRAYAQLRSVARMAHELQGIEEQLKSIYGAAAQALQPDKPVVVALPDRAGPAHSRQATRDFDGAAEDAVAKPARQRQPAKAAAARKRAAAAPGPAQRLSKNDEKVLAYLKKVLNRRGWSTLTQVAIARGAGIPLGSIGLAIRRVLATGAVHEQGKGNYRLA